MNMPQVLIFELELGSSDQVRKLVADGGVWVGEGPWKDIKVEVRSMEQGHSFGLSEVVDVMVSVGAGVSSDLVADAVKKAVGTAIRRVRCGSRRSDGGSTAFTAMIEDERSRHDEVNDEGQPAD